MSGSLAVFMSTPDLGGGAALRLFGFGGRLALDDATAADC